MNKNVITMTSKIKEERPSTKDRKELERGVELGFYAKPRTQPDGSYYSDRGMLHSYQLELK